MSSKNNYVKQNPMTAPTTAPTASPVSVPTIEVAIPPSIAPSPAPTPSPTRALICVLALISVFVQRIKCSQLLCAKLYSLILPINFRALSIASSPEYIHGYWSISTSLASFIFTSSTTPLSTLLWMTSSSVSLKTWTTMR